MGDRARVRDGLRAAAFGFRARNAVLRPDLHRHTNDVVTLFAQQIARDTGIDPAAHAEEDALFFPIHRTGKVGAIAGMVNATGTIVAAGFRAVAYAVSAHELGG